MTIYRIFEFTELAYHSVNFLILKILILTEKILFLLQLTTILKR